jgi:NADPH:quinone reductase-like Zn-dependent oxidoreductase
MKAIVMRRYGGPEVLDFIDLETPKPNPRDVLVRMRAASINPIETKIRAGAQRLMIRYNLPWVLGLDLSGVVEALGTEVTDFKLGDEVCASLDYKRPGSYAEAVLVDQSLLARKPKSLSFEQAAALPLAGLTAWQSLVSTASIQAGERVFIQAGAGGVGHLAIQIAKARGAWVATTASARNSDFLRKLGADLIIDHQSQSYENAFDQAGLKMDLVLEAMGGEHRQRCLNVLAPGGRHVSIVSDLPKSVAKHGALLGTIRALGGVASFMMRARLRGFRPSMVVQRPNAEQLTSLLAMAEKGPLEVTIAERFPLSKTAEAHRASESGRTRGKIVLIPD